MMYAYNRIKLIVSLACLACIFASGCGGSNSQENTRTKKLQDLHSKREAKIAQLKQMDMSQLAGELERDSRKGVEPFNSMAYAELLSRGQSVSRSLQPLLTKPDRSSLLALLALRTLDKSSYETLSPSFRVTVLVDAMQNATYFNTWGVPTDYWNEAAKAIIAEGAASVTALVPLLKDKRPALIWGSEGAVIDRQYHLRVCDYAWALVNEITNRKVPFPEGPEQRDELINESMKELTGLTNKNKPLR